MKIVALLIIAFGTVAAQTPNSAPTTPAPAKPRTPRAARGSGGEHGTAVRTLSYKDLRFPVLPEIKIPEIATFTLATGMKVYLLENHDLPLVRGTALVRTGNLFDPKEKVGLAEFTGSVMRSGGTKSKTGDQIDELLENMAASVESGIGETTGSVSFNTLKENTDDVMAVFKDVLTNPEFRQDKLDLAKSQMRSAITRRNDEASSIASRELDQIVYGKDTPFGWEIQYEHVDRIQRNDLIAMYKRYFFPANIVLAIQGDFATAEMRTRLEKLFSDWTYSQPPVPPFPEVTTKASAAIYLAVKEDVTQSFFEMGHLGGVLRDKDFPALSVMTDILGGGFSSRLFRIVRTQKGLAYGVSSGWGATYTHPGLFRISGSTKSGSTVDTIQATLAEVDRIRIQEVTNEELETAKQSVLNSFVFDFDSPSKTLTRMVTYDYYGYPKDFIFQYQKAIQAVTKADVLRVAKGYLHPDALVKVVAGNPKDFGKSLAALGKVTNVDLTIPEPARATAKADAGSLEQGRKMLAQRRKRWEERKVIRSKGLDSNL